MIWMLKFNNIFNGFHYKNLLFIRIFPIIITKSNNNSNRDNSNYVKNINTMLGRV